MNTKQANAKAYAEEQARIRQFRTAHAHEIQAVADETLSALTAAGMPLKAAQTMLVYIQQSTLATAISSKRVAFSSPERAEAIKAIDADHHNRMERVLKCHGAAFAAIREEVERKYADHLL